MGIFDFIKGQFIEVIEWVDASDSTMVYRVPMLNQQMKMGAQLEVGESQVAVFMSEDKVADVFLPGQYKISTQNLPVMTILKSWKSGFNSPFKAEVYYVNMKPFTDHKLGTINPIMVRDSEFGVLGLRAYGIYSFRVVDAEKFMMQIFGTNQIYDTEYIQGQLKSSLVSGVSDLLSESKIAALDLNGFYNELSRQAKDRIQHRFETLGLELVSLVIETISFPEEVETALDKISKLNILGDLQAYVKLKTVDAIVEAAKNPGGGTIAAGAGEGNELALEQVLGRDAADEEGSLVEVADEVAATAEAVAPTEIQKVAAEGVISAEIQKSAAKTPSIAAVAPKKQRNRKSNETTRKFNCIKCKVKIARGSKFCPECGTAQVMIHLCISCGNKLVGGTKFCAECGTKAE